MWLIIPLIALIVAVLDPINAYCSKGCMCPSTSSVVECNTIKLQQFGMHVFNLKIVNPTEPLILKGQPFNIQGLENVNTISIEKSTILEIEESVLTGIPLLSTLNIINCNIPVIRNSSVFSKAHGLRNLKIANSTLKIFEYVKAEQLEELVLSGNKLEEISNNSFSDLPSLTLINLSNNRISKVDPLAFSKLSYLQEIFLANNYITRIDYDLFKFNTELVTLDFTNNPLREFDINITADLEKLVLKSCQLEEISNNVASNLDYLSYLDLSNNNIKFTNTTFTKMVELDYIDLSDNNLSTLDPHIFRANNKLQKIILDKNNFESLPKFVCSGGNFETYLFSCVHCNISNLSVETFKQFPALVTINLSYNHISSVNLSAFHYLRSLIELDLSNNNITSIDSNAFTKSTALEKLNLAGNHIDAIDPIVFENNRVLKTLDLSSCSLRQLWAQPKKKAISSLRQLILVNNDLSKITLADLAVINAIEVLDISNNPLVCDKNLKEIIAWLNEHEVSPVTFKTHEEMNAVDVVVFEGTAGHWSWKDVAKEKCSEQYYIENFETKHMEIEVEKKTTNAPEDYDYQYADFDSDEDSTTLDNSNDAHQIDNEIVGMKVSEIASPSENNDDKYSFLLPTLVFVFTSLSVLVIAANIMLLMLRSTGIPRKFNSPYLKIPPWTSNNKLKKHSGSVYRPLSEEKDDTCHTISGTQLPTPIHKSGNSFA